MNFEYFTATSEFQAFSLHDAEMDGLMTRHPKAQVSLIHVEHAIE